jgi:hypothetical protein
VGRLTLNMLLSFAQFEREVTGERLRDKTAAMLSWARCAVLKEELDRNGIVTANGVERTNGASAVAPSLLAGLIFDANGEPMTPAHANKKGRRYRYYVTHSLIKRGRRKIHALKNMKNTVISIY